MSFAKKIKKYFVAWKKKLERKLGYNVFKLIVISRFEFLFRAKKKSTDTNDHRRNRA